MTFTAKTTAIKSLQGGLWWNVASVLCQGPVNFSFKKQGKTKTWQTRDKEERWLSCLSSWQRGTRKGRKRGVVCLTGVRQAMTTDCRSACQAGFCPSGSLSVGVQRAREECVCPTVPRFPWHVNTTIFQSKECEATTHIKKFSKATEHDCLCCCVHVPPALSKVHCHFYKVAA